MSDGSESHGTGFEGVCFEAIRFETIDFVGIGSEGIYFGETASVGIDFLWITRTYIGFNLSEHLSYDLGGT